MTTTAATGSFLLDLVLELHERFGSPEAALEALTAYNATN